MVHGWPALVCYGEIGKNWHGWFVTLQMPSGSVETFAVRRIHCLVVPAGGGDLGRGKRIMELWNFYGEIGFKFM